jgi:hypothetical protein
MGAAAAGFVFLTVLIGALLLADLAPEGSVRWLVSGHVVLALIAAIVVCVAGFGGSGAVGVGALVLLLGAVGLGITVYRRSAGSSVSKGMLIVHGAAAGLTILFTVLVAVR